MLVSNKGSIVNILKQNEKLTRYILAHDNNFINCLEDGIFVYIDPNGRAIKYSSKKKDVILPYRDYELSSNETIFKVYLSTLNLYPWQQLQEWVLGVYVTYDADSGKIVNDITIKDDIVIDDVCVSYYNFDNNFKDVTSLYGSLLDRLHSLDVKKYSGLCDEYFDIYTFGDLANKENEFLDGLASAYPIHSVIVDGDKNLSRVYISESSVEGEYLIYVTGNE